jgi:D-sedoheptulose 7-phosphate isomerase
MTFSMDFLAEAKQVIEGLSQEAIERLAEKLASVRDKGGRLFILGVGGSAASASHAVNDFRKICGFEAYAPTDNVSELTARTNDEGWDTIFSEWLKGSKIGPSDGVLVFSVGGGNLERGVSPNLVKALELAKSAKASIFGVVGRDGGYTATVADEAVIIPTVNPERITPHTEAFHGVIWHLLVSHPVLKNKATMWESLAK